MNTNGSLVIQHGDSERVKSELLLLQHSVIAPNTWNFIVLVHHANLFLSTHGETVHVYVNGTQTDVM